MLCCIFIPRQRKAYENEDSGYLFFSSLRMKKSEKRPPKNGWTLYSGNRICYRYRRHDGKKYLYQKYKDTITAPGYRNVNIPVTPGIMYPLKRCNLTEGDCQIYVEFWNGSTRLPVNDIFTFNSNEWTTATLNAVAPEKAQTMTILLYQTTANAGTAYFDNIRVKIGKDYNEVGSEKYDHLVSGYPRLFFTKDNLPSIKALKDDTTPNYAGTARKRWLRESFQPGRLPCRKFFTCNITAIILLHPISLIMPGKAANPPTYLASRTRSLLTALGTAINARLLYSRWLMCSRTTKNMRARQPISAFGSLNGKLVGFDLRNGIAVLTADI